MKTVSKLDKCHEYLSPGWLEYCDKLRALVPVDTHEKALAYKKVWEEYYGEKMECPYQ